RRTVRPQLALGRILELFRRDPAHALDEPADDLAAVDAGVDRFADVHEQIDALDAHLAGEAVEQDLRAGDAVGEVKERRAAAGVAVEVDAGGRVEAAGAQVDPLLVRPAAEGAEG